MRLDHRVVLSVHREKVRSDRLPCGKNLNCLEIFFTFFKGQAGATERHSYRFRIGKVI